MNNFTIYVDMIRTLILGLNDILTYVIFIVFFFIAFKIVISFINGSIR